MAHLFSSKNPTFLILFFLSSLLFLTAQQCNHHHFAALLHLKHGFHFSPYRHSLPSWNSNNTDCCSWEGITCDGPTGHVISLDLSELFISGRIDFDSLFRLRSLQRLNLAYNDFDGSPIPSGFDQLTSLTHLNLSRLHFYGQIPLEISRLTTLVSLDLSRNEYRNGSDSKYLKLENPNIGAVVQNLSNLSELYLDWVHILLQGQTLDLPLPYLRKLSLIDCSIFSSLSHLHFLSELYLSYNNLSSAVPSFPGSLRKLILYECGSIYSSLSQLHFLSELDLSHNDLSSAIDSLINLQFLTHLRLTNCNLSGSLPPSLLNLTKLQYLYLSSNKLSGPIPSSYGNELLNLKVIDLGNNLLNGTIPSSLLSLPSLQRLDLTGNQLSGQLGGFHNASSSQLEYILLGNNKLQGMIPRFIFQLTKLQILSLSSNNFSGAVELGLFQNFKNLYSLDLSDNNLSVQDGSGNFTFVSIPQIEYLLLRSCNISTFPNFLRNQEGLRELDLSNNKISGEIPKWIWEIPPCLGEIGGTLSVLNLQGNAFNGTLLHTFKEGCNIQTLDLSGNQLKGQVPKSLANCKMLEVLNLGKNQIQDTFPLWLEALSQLRVLILRSNQFHGTIGHPQAFPLLQIFDLSFNSFEGNLPSNMFKSWKAMMEEDKSQSLILGKMISGNRSSGSSIYYQNIYYQNKVSLVSKGLQMELVKILTAFTVVDLSENKFHGDIPESIGVLKSLLVLNMSNNDLTGGIPTSLQNLRDLESLDLSHNKLSGEIPWQLTDLTFLAVLNLSQNFLVGKIPQSRQFLTFNSESFKENSGLCGPPLLKKCEDVESAPPSPLSTLQSERKYDWELMWIGFGVGHGLFVAFAPA
ncbi:receptor-like protein 53 [Magnolia sinica]|uniref:receptor-like protein 53 n=1 Tax=Magnolia sinica TaxID=86752 RepID=UPI00265A1DE1|nr:receptor-like protein 53 [Magnolia sinica]